jgi:chromosomal replication initiator protein
MNDFISSVKDRQPERLHDRYRRLDVLLVDDIQFIGRGSGTKEEFFNDFNVLRDRGKQIVISSDKPPKELDNIDERLTSRFGSGLVVDIQPPDFETRAAILQKKSEMKGYDVPEDVIKFIAEKIPSNIRELEGTLNRITTYSITTNEPMTVENMYEWLKHDLKRGDGVSVDYIQQLAAESFGVTIEDLASQKRTADIALARQVAMYVACEKMEGSLQVIGSAFQRDHATVIHARNKIEKMIKDDPRIKTVVDGIMEKL